MAKILVVDDRPTNRQFLLTLLGYTGHGLLEAANGAEALERVRADRPDLVITDILMPTMDGYEFVRHLRADPDLASVPVIFHTATYSEPQAQALADSCGVRIVLPKPCDPERIMAAVNEALGVVDAAASVPVAAAQGGKEGGELHKVGDKLVEFIDELQSVKSKFDDIVESSGKLRARRDEVRQLSEQFSRNVVSLQHIASKLSAIIEVGMEMTSERDPRRLVELFFAAACDIIDSDYAAIGMLDEREHGLRFIFAKGVEAQVYQDADRSRTGVLGALLAGRRPLRSRSAGAGADGLPPGHPPVRSSLGVPVASKERVYGWLFFADKRGEDGFSEEDERLAAMMAAKLAVLYENALLYDVIQRHAAQLQVEVSERRQAEQAARAGETKYRELIEQAADGIFVTDDRGNFLLANRRYCQMLGCAEAELSKLNVVLTYPEEDRAAFAERIEQLKEVESRLIERMILRKDGTLFPAEVSMRHLSNGTHQGIVRDISERKQAAAALAESEAGLRRAQLMAKLAHVITRPDGSFERWSDTLPQLIGVESAQMPRSTREWLDILHPDDRARFRATAIEAGRKGARADVEYRLRRADGAWIQLRQAIEPLQGDADAARETRWFSTLQDVTEQRQAQMALAESNERFREMAENIRDVFFLMDLKTGGMLYVSPAYQEVWGRTCGSLYADPQSWAEAIHPDDRDHIGRKFSEQLATGWFDSEYRIVRPDGDVRWIHVRTFSILDESGKPYRSAGVAEDITERKRAAEELRESERRFRDVLSKVELVSLMLDREARITYCNDYLLRLTGWKREEVLGGNWFELFIPRELTRAKEVFSALLADLPEAWHHENEILTRAGARRLIRWNNSVLRSVSGEVIGTASIGEDISEQKQAEIHIRSLNRVYAVLSGINTLIVRVRDRQELFDEACRIAVEDGNFGMAWIGEVDRSTLEVTPVAWRDMEGDVASLKASARDDIPEGQGMVGRAIRAKKPVITNDVGADPGAGGPRRKEALRRGFQSIIAMPLIVDGEVMATLTLFARERNFFSGDELKLLTELAGDISFALDHIEKSERLDYLAYYDASTGLANRKLFLERVDQRIRIAAEQKGRLALAILDVERFKSINDTLGRHAGDQLLKVLAERFVKFLDDPDRVGRVLGDQFGIVIPDVHSEDEVARRVEQKLKECVGVPIRLGDSELRISAKAGIAVYPEDGAEADTLFRNAEAALKRAKAAGERYLFYTQQMTERVGENLALENKLRQALEKEEFVLHYQPKVDTATRRIESVEALIRWQSRELGLVPPMHFIPLLEETGLILEVGAWALRRAALDHRRWLEQGLNAPRIAVNVSAIQVRRRDFVETTLDSIEKEGSRAAIDIEVTESLIMEDIEANIVKFEALRLAGMEIAIDDFGTGYSSLGYLAKFPVQSLKIDRSFVISMLKDPAVMTLVSMMVSLAHTLKLKVVAEGVDSEDQASALKQLGCDQLQGYLISKPRPFNEIAKLLGSGPAIPILKK